MKPSLQPRYGTYSSSQKFTYIPLSFQPHSREPQIFLSPALGCFLMCMHWLILSLNLKKVPFHISRDLCAALQNSALQTLATLAFLDFHTHFFNWVLQQFFLTVLQSGNSRP